MRYDYYLLGYASRAFMVAMNTPSASIPVAA